MPILKPDYYEYLDDDENSEDDVSLSSNEENNDINIYLHTKHGTRHFKKSDENLQKINSNEFEETLETELNEMCKNYESNLFKEHQSTSKETANKSETLYDSDSDSENEKWIDDIRQSYQPLDIPNFRSKNFKTQKLPHSDAVLNCPCCMSLLCLDCQRHDTYKTQYRAMFVLNCCIDQSQNIYYPLSTQKFGSSKKRKKSKDFLSNSNEANAAPHSTEIVSPIDFVPAIGTDCPLNATDAQHSETRDILVLDGHPTFLPLNILNDARNIQNYDVYKNVNCSVCKTQVAVYDTEEVYHFYNVLSSY